MIERIIIENFKSIRKLDLELKPINILIGANGAGKSNFVSFFKLTNQIYEQRLQQYIGNNIDKLLYFGRDESESTQGIIDFNNSYSIGYAINPSKSDNTGYINRLELRFNSNNDAEKKYLEWTILFAQIGNYAEGNLIDIDQKSKLANDSNYADKYLAFVRPGQNYLKTFKFSPFSRKYRLSLSLFIRFIGDFSPVS